MRTPNTLTNALFALALTILSSSAIASDVQTATGIDGAAVVDKPAVNPPADRPQSITHTSPATDLGQNNEPSADLTHNGQVDIDDLVMLLSHWGACPATDAQCVGDFNGDHVINDQDLMYLIRQLNAGH